MADKGKLLEMAADDLVFYPDTEQRKVKSAFWVKAKDDPTIDPKVVPLALVLHFTGDSRVQKWWRQPGFKEWFTNTAEYAQKLEYLVAVGLEWAEEAFADKGMPAQAKVRLLEVLARLANKEPVKTREVKWADQDISKMDMPKLVAFLTKNSELLKQLGVGGSLEHTTSNSAEVSDDSGEDDSD